MRSKAQYCHDNAKKPTKLENIQVGFHCQPPAMSSGSFRMIHKARHGQSSTSRAHAMPWQSQGSSKPILGTSKWVPIANHLPGPQILGFKRADADKILPMTSFKGKAPASKMPRLLVIATAARSLDSIHQRQQFNKMYRSKIDISSKAPVLRKSISQGSNWPLNV